MAPWAALRFDSRPAQSNGYTFLGNLKRINVEVPDGLEAQIRSHMATLIGKNGRSIITWPTEDKKRLVELLFAKPEKGLGVFVSVHHHPEGGGKYWSYEMKGLPGAATGVNPTWTTYSSRNTHRSNHRAKWMRSPLASCSGA